MAKDEIKRHPQVEEETETTEVAEAEVVEEAEEISEEVAEALEDYEETEEESEDDGQSVYDDADDEFMESVTENKKPLSPEKAAEKEKALLAENEELQKRVIELEKIEELKKHEGWEILMENIKSALHILVDKEDSSLSKSAKKLEDIKGVRGTLDIYSSELYSKRSEIKSNEQELQGLKAIQKNLFDTEEKAADEDQGEKEEA